MSDHRNSDYLRRRREAEAKIERDGLMPTDPLIVGTVRMAIFEDLVAKHLPAEQPYKHESPPPAAQPTAAQAASVMNKPVVRDELTRRQAMEDGIAAEMAAARGETAA